MFLRHKVSLFQFVTILEDEERIYYAGLNIITLLT